MIEIARVVIGLATVVLYLTNGQLCLTVNGSELVRGDGATFHSEIENVSSTSKDWNQKTALKAMLTIIDLMDQRDA